MSLGKCKKCGGEPWIQSQRAESAMGLYRVVCVEEDAMTGWYESENIATNIWDSYFADNAKLFDGMPTFGFGSALWHLKQSQSVSRMNWNGKGQHLTLQVPDQNSKMSLPYIYITTVQGDRVPWLASQTDMLADDWYIVE